jgi:hypothetical protein
MRGPKSPHGQSKLYWTEPCRRLIELDSAARLRARTELSELPMVKRVPSVSMFASRHCVSIYKAFSAVCVIRTDRLVSVANEKFQCLEP